ncbi:MAG: hypothetical protein ABR564_07620 [Candidatus Dormibacteria bacterium]
MGRGAGRDRSAALAVLPLVLLLMGLAACGGLDEDQLHTRAQTLSGDAAEGALLATQDGDGRVGSGFVQVHARELSEATADISDALRTAHAGGDLGRRASRLAHVAAQARAVLEAVAQNPDNHRLLQSAARELGAEARSAEQIGGGP